MTKTTLRKINTNFILIFMYWIIFEWPLLSKINNLSIISIIRSAIDLLPFLLMILNILFQKGKMKKYELAIFIVLLLILIIVSLSTLIEGYNPLTAIQLVSVSFRYVPFLILIRLSTPKIMKKFYKHVRIIFWLMVVISVFEIANKALFMKFFLPSPSIFGESLPTIYYSKNIEISATFINTIDFSFFIIALSCFYIIQTKKETEKVIVFITALVLLFLSFSVASLIEGADAAAKSANVKLIEVRLAMALGGKAFVTLTGNVAAVRSAVESGAQVIAKKGLLVNKVVIPQPRKELLSEMI